MWFERLRGKRAISPTVLDNGNVCLTDSPCNVTTPFNRPFVLALTQEVGLNRGNAVNAKTPFPATTHVDWVRDWAPAA